MKKLIITLGLVLLILAGCGVPKFDLSVVNTPKYIAGDETEIVLRVEDGEPVTGATITGSLEMARMDHGVKVANFEDNGDGTYTALVALDMSGEWIMSTELEHDGETYEETLTLNVEG